MRINISTLISNSNHRYELAECVEGAVCNTDGICQCPDTFYEDFDANKCTLRKDFGEACGSSLECNLQKMLICGGNRTCECFNPDEMTYIRIDNESSSCKVKVGRNCIGVFDTFRQAIRNQIIASNGTVSSCISKCKSYISKISTNNLVNTGQ